MEPLKTWIVKFIERSCKYSVVWNDINEELLQLLMVYKRMLINDSKLKISTAGKMFGDTISVSYCVQKHNQSILFHRVVRINSLIPNVYNNCIFNNKTFVCFPLFCDLNLRQWCGKLTRELKGNWIVEAMSWDWVLTATEEVFE